MENWTSFRHGHSGYPLNIITTSGRFRIDFFDDEAVTFRRKALWTVQNKDGGDYTNRATKNLDFSIT